MITIKKNIKLKYRPGDKFRGYWFSGETFREMMDQFINSEHNFLLKGHSQKDQYLSLILADPVDIIGYVKDYTEQEITVELNVGIIHKGLLDLIMEDKLYVAPAMIVNSRDQYTNEILGARILSFELTC